MQRKMEKVMILREILIIISERKIEYGQKDMDYSLSFYKRILRL